ncbi:MAG: helix-turn-helix transcriptional regulator [Lachnospiraceae bacterium]|nr:helix-turn-helix transcriptional regulator [Lachnospiraceae bacterium]
MTIRDRIFEKLEELDMTQKEFSEKTGIPQTTVSDGRKKKTNPTAEKIMVICKVLNVTPEWLLSGVEMHGTRSNPMDWYAVDPETDAGKIITAFNSFDSGNQKRLLGYAQALQAVNEDVL